MSTKIYSGYRVRLDKDANVVSFSNVIREFMLPIVEKIMLADIISMATDLYDSRSLIESGLINPEEKTTDDFWVTAFDKLAKERKDHGDRYGFSVTFHTDSISPDYLYFIVITNQRQWETEFAKEFSQRDNVESYCYWNNSDPKEDVSEEEWEKRGETWKRIGVTHHALNEVGLVMTLKGDYAPRGEFLLKEYPVFNKETAETLFPPFSARVKNNVRNLYFFRNPAPTDDPNSIMTKFYDAVYFSSTPSPELDAMVNEVSSVLKEDVSLLDLNCLIIS